MSTFGWVILILFGLLYWGQKMAASKNITFSVFVQTLIIPVFLVVFIYTASIVSIMVTLAIEQLIGFVAMSMNKYDKPKIVVPILAFAITGLVVLGFYGLIQYVR